MTQPNLHQALHGSLLGTAVGDAYGLPFEGLSPKRASKWFNGDGRYHFVPMVHGGMVSDDTEHAVMTVQAWTQSAGNPTKFRLFLRLRLMLWLCGLPAGVGLATGRSIIKMWLGFKHTGVFSAGNGTAMRASVLGVLCADIDTLKTLVHSSTTLTHTDPKAYQGALLVALLAWAECHQPTWTSEQMLAFAIGHLDDNELIERLSTYQTNPKTGITGYIYDTVPAVVKAWQSHRNTPMAGLNALIAQGGDTDTTAAIFGGIVGVRHGQAMFAQMQGVWCEPVLTPKFLTKLATQAKTASEQQTPIFPVCFGGLRSLIRNLGFLAVVLLHGFRRLLPPY